MASSDFRLEIDRLIGNERHPVHYVSPETFATLDGKAIGIPTIFTMFGDGTIRMWPCPTTADCYKLDLVEKSF